MYKKITTLIDKVGMCASLLCMLHCLVVPVAFVFGVNSLLLAIDHEWLERVIILASLFIGLIAFMQGFFRHRQHFIPVLFTAGFLLLVNGESVQHTWLSAGLSVAGAAVIIYAHYQNLKWKQYASAR